MNATKIPVVDKPLTNEQIQVIKEYVGGKSVSPNETVTYFIEKLKSVKMELEEVGKQVQELRKLLAIATERFTGLNAQYNAYGRDLLQWLEKEACEQKTVFTPEERAAMLKRPQIIKPGEDQRSSG